MDSIDFKPNKEYLDLIEVSNQRKKNLGLQNLTYKQLIRRKVLTNYGYELHHIVPRYRMKNISVKDKNRAENIALLTSLEHIFAHLYLTQFETGNYFYSASMAFIQLTNLNKIEDFTDVSQEQQGILLENISRSRRMYFSSEFNKNVRRKAGKSSGNKRKERFLNDLEFKNYLLNCLKLTDEQKKAIAKRKIEKNSALPPWEINKSRQKENRKYIPQYWHLFDCIYEGVLKYGLSYKAIGNILNVDYRRISNIVRIIKHRYSNHPEDFKNFIHFNAFIESFESTLEANREKFERYSGLSKDLKEK